MPSIGISKKQPSSSVAPRRPPSLLDKLRRSRHRSSSSSSTTSSSVSTLRLLTKTGKSGKNKPKSNTIPTRSSKDKPTVPNRKTAVSTPVDGSEAVAILAAASVASRATFSTSSRFRSSVGGGNNSAEEEAPTISIVEDTTTAFITSAIASCDSQKEEISVSPISLDSANQPESSSKDSINDDDDVDVTEEDVIEESSSISFGTPIAEELVTTSLQQSQDQTSDKSGTKASAVVSNDDDTDDADLLIDDNTLREGISVRISNGKYKNKTGIVSKMTEKMVYVTIAGIDKDPRVNKSSVEIIQRGPQAQTASPSPVASQSSKLPEKTTNDDKSKASILLSFEAGQTITVIKESSDYVGKSGRIVKVNSKMLRVILDGVDGEKSLSKKSVEIVPSNALQRPMDIFRTSHHHRPTDLQLDVPLDCDTGMSSISLATGILTPTSTVGQIDDGKVIPCPDASVLSINYSAAGQEVTIFKGKYKGKTARLVKMLPKSLKVEIDGREVTVRMTSVSEYAGTGGSSASSSIASSSISTPTRRATIDAMSDGAEWRVPDSKGGGTRFGSRVIEKIRISTEREKADFTFLNHFLGDRMKIVEIPLTSEEVTEPFDIAAHEEGRAYELMSVKVVEDKDGPSMPFCKKKCARLIYCQTEAPRLQPLSAEDELMKLANFAALSPRKCLARLELLQSPALKLRKRPGIFFLNARQASEIDDNGNDGCGFIDEDFLTTLLPDGKNSKTLAIQVRFLAPSMGIFKGMLMRRRIVDGPPIQLTPTMKKVAASPTNPLDDRACLVITQAGKHPSPMNHYIGRKINPSLRPPPPKSFSAMLKDKALNKKKLEDKMDMIPRLLLALGAEKATLSAYLKRSLTIKGVSHAYVVGVADPTYTLPPGCVFVTGFSHVSTPNGEILVTRSPCAKYSDARLLPMATHKPDTMEQRDWDWLHTLPFGAIIFANPNKGVEPLPAQIAKGDLDGDLYFLMWDISILEQVKPDPVVEVPITCNIDLEKEGSNNSVHEERVGLEPKKGWLKEAQQLMADSAAVQDIGALTGSLYKLAEKTADASNLFMRDPDSIAFADAYNQALEFGKHGGKITLPLHLHSKVPARLRKHLSAPATTNYL